MNKNRTKSLYLAYGIGVFLLFFLDSIENKLLAQNKILQTPVDTSKTAKSTPIEETIFYSADSVDFRVIERKVFLYKNGIVTFGKTELKAESIEFDLDKNIAIAIGIKDSLGKVIGKPKFKDGAENFDADKIIYNFKSKKGVIKGVITEQEGGFLHGETVKKQDCGEIHIENGMYTTCDKVHPDFYIKLSKAIVVPKDKIVSGPLYFVIQDIPLPIGLPFGFFPNKGRRASGFLIPKYGEENRRGFNLSDGGFYFALSDNIDLSLSGDVFSKGTWGVRAQSKYYQRYRFSGNFNLQFYTNVDGEKGLPDYTKSRSASIRWTHTQDPKANPFRSFSANVDYETNGFNTKNVTSYGNYFNTQKSSSVSFSRRFPNSPFNLTANLQARQNTQNKQVNITSPVINFSMNTIYPFRRKKSKELPKWYEKITLGYNSNLTNTVETSDSLLFKPQTLNKFIFGYKHDIPFNIPIKLLPWISFTPSMGYSGFLYAKKINKTWFYATETTKAHLKVDTINIMSYAQQFTPSVGAALQQRFYGIYQFKPAFIRKRIEAIRHMVYPVVSFSFVPQTGNRDKYYKKVQMDSTGKNIQEYSIYEGVGPYGTPSTGQKSASFNFNFDNEIEMKVKDRKDSTGKFKNIKLLSIRMNTSYNVFADSMHLSNINLSGETQLTEKFRINFGANFDPYVTNNKGMRINKFLWDANQKPFRMISANASTSFNFQPNVDNTGKKITPGQATRTMYNPIYYAYPIQYADFNIPWTFSVNYSFGYSNSFDYTEKAFKGKITQSAGFNASLSLTSKTKISLTSNYDFQYKKFAGTNINISRDLHCWQMTINWIPTGVLRSYFFQINIKSSVLESVKYKKDKSWYDNY